MEHEDKFDDFDNMLFDYYEKNRYIPVSTQNAIKNTQYNCPAGYNKIGLGPESICTKGNTTQVNPTVSSKQVTKYRYQWSQLEQLDGWERTGETRQVKASATPAK